MSCVLLSWRRRPLSREGFFWCALGCHSGKLRACAQVRNNHGHWPIPEAQLPEAGCTSLLARAGNPTVIVIRADGDVRIPEGFGTIDKYEVCEYACSVGVISCGSWIKEASRKHCWQPDQVYCAAGRVHELPPAQALAGNAM